MIVDPKNYNWGDSSWSGLTPSDQVIYEMHIGTFTQEGTFTAAAKKLRFLGEIGITCIEIMPINEFQGDFGWGYDGVFPYAPTRVYGTPNDVRAFVDAAHGLGIGVILDVVYNHFGAGERLGEFTPDYFTERYWNEWGKSINFDGSNSDGVRAFICANAAFWIDEYHFDGLRLDATQALFDCSDVHIISEIGLQARKAANGKPIYLVAENEPQETHLVRRAAEGGMDLDALWNDDFHHSAMVALSGKNEAYYHDHRGRSQEFVSAFKYGYLFQGQRYDWQNAARGHGVAP
jgi:maltooligosyltrehalose trehalohydrolase